MGRIYKSPEVLKSKDSRKFWTTVSGTPIPFHPHRPFFSHFSAADGEQRPFAGT